MNLLLKLSYLNSKFALALGYHDVVLNNPEKRLLLAHILSS